MPGQTELQVGRGRGKDGWWQDVWLHRMVRDVGPGLDEGWVCRGKEL